MTSTISGNVGGTAASGAQVQCTNIQTGVILAAAADGSGNYTFSGLAAGTYRIQAALASNQYLPGGKTIVVDGASTYSNVNLNPIALNAVNAPPSATALF